MHPQRAHHGSATGPFPLYDEDANKDYVYLSVGSRKRWITPEDDNFGFAAWAYEHAHELVAVLGYGRHYGEWWGKGIQRGYDLDERRLSLFNVNRWRFSDLPERVETVPIISTCQGLDLSAALDVALDDLRYGGSYAAPGFRNPEGVVAYHEAAKQMFKMTLEGDEPKSRQAA